MDPSLNPYKGYGKIEIEDQPHHPKPSRKPILLLTVAAVLLLTLTIAFTLTALLHRQPSSSSSLDSSIKFVCNVTRYPESCFSAISSLNTLPKSADPEAIFKLSLRVAIDAVSGVSSLVKSSANSGPAVGDCGALLEDAAGRLNESMAATGLEVEASVGDVQTWISTAVTDLETCTDGLEEMGSTLDEQVNKGMVVCKELTSNSLAIIANMKDLSEKFRNSTP